MEKLNTKQTIGIIGIVLMFLLSMISVCAAIFFLVLTICFISTEVVGLFYLLFFFSYLLIAFFQLGAMAFAVYTAQIMNKKNEIKINQIMKERFDKIQKNDIKNNKAE